MTQDTCTPTPVAAPRTLSLDVAGGTATLTMTDDTTWDSAVLTFDGGAGMYLRTRNLGAWCTPGCDGGLRDCHQVEAWLSFAGQSALSGTMRSSVSRELLCVSGSSLCFVTWAVDGGR